MKTRRRLTSTLILLGATITLMLTDRAMASGCAPAAACTETPSFIATVTSLRESTQGARQIVTATVRFENRTSKPLTLGYIRDSGVAIDEQGNRFVIPGAGQVRAIGVIDGTTFDPKFTLAANQASDARFELVLDPAKSGTRTNYELELAIREIVPGSGGQQSLGAEYALHFPTLNASTGKAGAGAAVAATPATAAPAAPADPCAGSPRCYNAGAFIAEVMQLQVSAAGASRHQTISLNVRFRNVSDKPIILGYQSASSAGRDNFGNTYYWGRAGTHDTSVKGIGYVTGRTADPQFTLNPAQTRNATFGLIRYEAKPPYGVTFNYDVVIPEIEILPGQQIRTVRQNSVSFANLAPGSFSGVSGVTADGTAAPAGTQDVTEVAGKVIDLFNKLKNQ